jgi:hypothetical protein
MTIALDRVAEVLALGARPGIRSALAEETVLSVSEDRGLRCDWQLTDLGRVSGCRQ